MSSTQITLAVAVVLLFWMVGAYNRLVRLRSAIGTAWTQFEAQLQRRADALPALLAPLEAAMPAERPAIEAVRTAEMQVTQAGVHLRASPVCADSAAALFVGLAQLDSALSRLLALLDQHAELRAIPEVAASLRELHDVDLRLAFARQLFNGATEAYNQALDQFPTRLLAGLFRFHPAGRL
jgi:LemA protein